MAIGSTVYKVQLGLADMDRHHYADYDLTLARHPSETDFRLMIRLIAFALNADERLEFTKGLCAEDEPELWIKEYDGAIRLWIELGQPDEKRLRKACGRAERVIVYTYQERPAKAWYAAQKTKMARFSNLSLIHLHADAGLETLAQRTMQLQCNVQDGVLSLHSEAGDVSVKPEPWGASAHE